MMHTWLLRSISIFHCVAMYLMLSCISGVMQNFLQMFLDSRVTYVSRLYFAQASLVLQRVSSPSTSLKTSENSTGPPHSQNCGWK